MANPKTGHKTFDSQFDYVGTGSVISRVQLSSCIRPCNSTDIFFATKQSEGLFQAFDLESFDYIPLDVKKFAKEATQEEAAILYKFRSWNGTDQVVHGWVVTDINGKHLKSFYTRNTPKSHAVVDTCAKLVTTEETPKENCNDLN